MIELHTSATANGYKASIMLEECALPYSVTRYDLPRGETQTPAFLARNPAGRIPVIVDDTAAGEPVTVYGTQAIVHYLAEKTGRLLPDAPAARASVLTWCGFIASDLAGAYAGQFAFSLLAKEPQPWGLAFYNGLADRFLGVVERQLAAHRHLAGDDYTIADVLAYPSLTVSTKRYPGSLASYPAIARYVTEVGARPAVQRGMQVPA